MLETRANVYPSYSHRREYPLPPPGRKEGRDRRLRVPARHSLFPRDQEELWAQVSAFWFLLFSKRPPVERLVGICVSHAVSAGDAACASVDGCVGSGETGGAWAEVSVRVTGSRVLPSVLSELGREISG